MEISYGLLLLCGVAALVVALPTNSDDKSPQNFASQISQVIATNLLKSNIDIDGNQVHSPLGVTSILAVLAEGSDGDTYNEFTAALGFPADRAALRSTFHTLLGKYHNRDSGNADPSFQMWLYVYRNNTAREEFKQIMRDTYYVEVKDINRLDYDWSVPNTALNLDGGTTTATTSASNSKDVIGFETLKRIKLADDDLSGTTVGDYGEEIVDKEASKFDRVVDDKQYVEKPVILEEIQKAQQEEAQKLEKPEKPAEVEKVEAEAQPDAPQPEGMTVVAVEKTVMKREQDEDNETVQVDEKKMLKETPADRLVVPIQDVLDSNAPQKVSIPLQQLESAIEAAVKGDAGEIMLALESHIRAVRRVYGARSLFHKDDITTALSANSITGRDEGSKAKMLLFNGLYYRGNWANAFTELTGDDNDDFFYMTAEDAMKTPMMQAKGLYHVAEMPHLNAKVLCLPYENKKYGMILVVPNELEGLRGVIDKLEPSDFKLARSKAVQKSLLIKMPKFQIEETSRSEAMLKSMGLRKIFSRKEADLQFLSDDSDIHVDEVVQFVSVRVDEGDAGTSALSATIGEERHATNAGEAKAEPEAEAELLEINRPFVYFIMDCEEEFVIASGKVYTPDLKDDLSISIEVELDRV